MEMSGQGNVQLGKCLSGEMFSRGSLHWGSVQLGNCLFGKMSIREVSVRVCPRGNVSRGYVCIPFLGSSNIITFLVNMWNGLNKKNFMASFYGWGSTASRLDSLRWGSSLFTTKFPEIPGTHFIDLGRMKGWVDLGDTKWFWTQDQWIGNPAP